MGLPVRLHGGRGHPCLLEAYMSLKKLLFLCLAVAVMSAAMLLPSSTSTLAPFPTLLADSVKCDMTQYKAAQGLTATMEQDVLAVSWTGQSGAELRARYAIDNGQPLIRDLSIRKAGGQFTSLGQNLSPEYHVVSGIRRLGQDQAAPLRQAGIFTEENITKNRWYAFWDAPLVLPGGPEMQDSAARGRALAAGRAGRGGGRGGRGGNADGGGRGQQDPLQPSRAFGPPRTSAEIKRADATFHATSCSVKTDGQSLEVTFPGLSMGIFAGDLRFTMYRGTNLIRMDAAAKTSEEWIAYKYDAGLKGFSTESTPRVTWHDTGGHPQQNQFGGVVNPAVARVKAENRLIIAEGKGASLASFPPPHTFFFTREKDTNLGYVWYRKDAEGRFGMGVGMPEREEDAQYVENFALYNAPPGTVQKMGVYFYVSPDVGEAARQGPMAFTHGDVFKPVPGYKTMVNHFHLDFTGRTRVTGFDTPLQDLVAMRSIGLNIIGLSDFHFELHPNDPGPVRFAEEKDYFEATRRASDKDFLVTAWEEPSAYFGGHYNIMWPKNVYWSKVRQQGQTFTRSEEHTSE